MAHITTAAVQLKSSADSSSVGLVCGLVGGSDWVMSHKSSGPKATCAHTQKKLESLLQFNWTSRRLQLENLLLQCNNLFISPSPSSETITDAAERVTSQIIASNVDAHILDPGFFIYLMM